MSSAIPRSPEGVKDAISSLRDTVNDLQARMEAFSLWKNTTNDRLDRNERELERKDELIEQLQKENEEIRTIAEQALTVASAGTANPETEPKKDLAKRLTRNEVVRRAAMGASAQDRPVTAAEVEDMALPERELYYQSIKDGWKALQADWACFRETKKRGSKAITAKSTDLPKSLIRAVEVDLGRDDLTKRIISDRSASKSTKRLITDEGEEGGD